MTINRADVPRVLLATLRTVGAGSFVGPRLAVKTFGLREQAESSYLVRLFGARNLALTAGLLVSRGNARRLWWQLGVACDALDVVAAVLAAREGKPGSSAAVDGGASLIAAGLGVAGLIVEGG